MRLPSILALAAIGIVAACSDNADQARPMPKARLDLHLTGPHVRVFSPPPGFVEVTRKVLHGTPTPDGGCTLHDTTTSDDAAERNAGYVIERDMSTCTYLMAVGHQSNVPSSDELAADSAVDKVDQSQAVQRVSHASARRGVVGPATTRVGYNTSFPVSQWYLEQTLTWNAHGSTVSGGVGTRVFYYPAGWGISESIGGTLTNNTSNYDDFDYVSGFIVVQAESPFCGVPGTYNFGLSGHIWGYADGSFSFTKDWYHPGDCVGDLSEYYLIIGQ